MIMTRVFTSIRHYKLSELTPETLIQVFIRIIVTKYYLYKINLVEELTNLSRPGFNLNKIANRFSHDSRGGLSAKVRRM